MKTKTNLIIQTILAIFLIPTIINATTKSIYLLINGFESYANPFINSTIVISLNIVIAIALMIYTIIYIFLSYKNYPQIKQIYLQKQIALILYIILSAVIIWMISRISDPTQQFLNSLSTSWIISLIVSIIVLIYEWIKN